MGEVFCESEENPAIEHVEWLVNGRLAATTSGNSFTWQVERGTHTAQARIRFSHPGPPVETPMVRFLVK